MQGFLEQIARCTKHDIKSFMPFYISGVQFGWVKRDLAKLIQANFADDFEVKDNGIALTSAHDNYEKRTAALARAAKWISDYYKVPLRDEMYDIRNYWEDKSLAEIDRAAVPWFGTRGFGVHVNGFVRKADGIYMWIGERAKNRQVEPGKLDMIIGGGIPVGMTVGGNLIKEAWEEAGLNGDIARTATAQGALSYLVEHQLGLRNDTLFIYDLELPEHIKPNNTDGEVAAFHLMPLAEVARIIETTERFKFNCNTVVIDFLLRYDFITQTHKEFGKLSQIFKEMRKEP